MSLPSYKIINVNSFEKRMICAQLKQLSFKESPIVLIIEHLAENQLEAIENIELFIKENSIEVLPYSIYIIGNCPHYTGSLYIIPDKAHLPKFYNLKIKALNAKENNILKKVLLKRENFQSLKSQEFIPIIKEYGRGHRKINQLHKESLYYSKIQDGLEDYYDEKEK